MNADIVFSLRQSNQRLIELENALDADRDALINHKANDIRTMTDNAIHFNYMAMVEKYTGSIDAFNKECALFKDLLKQSADQAQPINNNEITSNYVVSTPSVSSFHNDTNTMITNESIATNSGNNEMIEREIATPNINFNTNAESTDNHDNYDNDEDDIKYDYDDQDEAPTMPQAQPQPIPKRLNRPKPKPITVKISNNMAYKYGGTGFDIWKKNGRRAIYTMTELYVNKVFTCDQAGKLKLKKFLMKYGFKANVIDKVEIINDKLSEHVYGKVSIRDSQDNIQKRMDKMNNNKDEAVIEYVFKKQYSSRRQQNKKLFVKNFDIVDKKDHKRMTDMFLRFGDLDEDIFMNRDKNGNPYCFVTYRDINDAIACEKNQNWRSKWNTDRDPLWFNGRELNIQYIDDSKKGKKKNSKMGKKYYNTRK